MLNSKTAGTIHAEMLMLQAGGWHGVFILVEGPSDHGFWRTYLKVSPEFIVMTEGVVNLQESMRSLPSPLVGSVCAIADQDFRHFLPMDPFTGCQDVFFYDEGFLETFLLNTPVFQKILAGYANHSKLSSFLTSIKPHTVYSYLRNMVSIYGQLRVLNRVHGWGLCFEKEFTLHKYVNETNWVLDEPRMIKDVASTIGWSENALQDACDAVGMRGSLKLVHGHDAVKALVIGLNKRLGSAKLGQDRLCFDLRLAFSKSDLLNKKLFRNLRSWAGQRRLI